MTWNWRDEAPCVDMGDLFFPAGEGREYRPQIELAKSVCQGCPVAQECLAEGMAEEGALHAASRFGIRAGLGPVERATLSRHRRRKAAKGGAP